jgi:pyruvyltransferase
LICRKEIPLLWKPDPNWGDALNAVLVKLLSGKTPRLSLDAWSGRYMAIGSILGEANAWTEVWGSGFIKQGQTLKHAPKKIHAVRGPLTRSALLETGIDCPEIYGDPALLFPYFYNPDVPPRYEVGIIPHCVDKSHPWIDKQRANRDVLIIDVEGDVYDFVRCVKSCKGILSSSLHGLICADAYGIPNAWIQLSDQVIGGDFKFRDYRLSNKAGEPRPFVITETSLLEDAVSKIKSYAIKINLQKLLLACPFASKEIKELLIGLIPSQVTDVFE